MNIFKETKAYLNENLKTNAKFLAQAVLEEKDYMKDYYLKAVSINKFLLNLVEAHDVNITPYLPKKEEEENNGTV